MLTVRSLVDFQTLYHHKINTTTASNMKTYRETKVLVLNPNLASKISYNEILNDSQSEAVNRSGVLGRYREREQRIFEQQ